MATCLERLENLNLFFSNNCPRGAKITPSKIWLWNDQRNLVLDRKTKFQTPSTHVGPAQTLMHKVIITARIVFGQFAICSETGKKRIRNAFLVSPASKLFRNKCLFTIVELSYGPFSYVDMPRTVELARQWRTGCFRPKIVLIPKKHCKSLIWNRVFFI